jgi:hypothetical protein
MKRKPGVALLLAVVCMAGQAIAQAADERDSTKFSPEVTAARCAYTLSDLACSSNIQQAPADSGKSPAQIPRRAPSPQYPRRSRCVRMARPMPQPSAKGAAIGGLIGFTLGAILPRDGDARSRVGVGVVLGAIGAGIGAAAGGSQPCGRCQRHRRPPDAEEMASNRRAGPVDPASDPFTGKSTTHRAREAEISTDGTHQGTASHSAASYESKPHLAGLHR